MRRSGRSPGRPWIETTIRPLASMTPTWSGRSPGRPWIETFRRCRHRAALLGAAGLRAGRGLKRTAYVEIAKGNGGAAGLRAGRGLKQFSTSRLMVGAGERPVSGPAVD